MPELVIIGGPNGAGKTSWALRYLEPTLGIREFINADEIARGLSPLDPDEFAFSAGRALINRVHACADARENFAFETTCAGRGHVRLLRKCRDNGYMLTLVFLWLPSVEAAIARVGRRVTEGGHNVPTAIIGRRYRAGLQNMRQLYLPLVDRGLIYDNSDKGGLLIAEHRPYKALIVHEPGRWSQIEETSR